MASALEVLELFDLLIFKYTVLHILGLSFACDITVLTSFFSVFCLISQRMAHFFLHGFTSKKITSFTSFSFSHFLILISNIHGTGTAWLTVPVSEAIHVNETWSLSPKSLPQSMESALKEQMGPWTCLEGTNIPLGLWSKRWPARGDDSAVSSSSCALTQE